MPATILDAGKALANKKTKFLLAWNFIVVGETESTQENKLKILIWLMSAAVNTRKPAAGRTEMYGGGASRLGKLRKTVFGLVV